VDGLVKRYQKAPVNAVDGVTFGVDRGHPIWPSCRSGLADARPAALVAGRDRVQPAVSLAVFAAIGTRGVIRRATD
jgi:hypothetical protein